MAGQCGGKGFERVSKTSKSEERAQGPLEGLGQASDRLPPLVLVTGPTSGLGRATAEAMAASGSRVVLAGRNAERLTAGAAQWASVGQGERSP